MIPISQLGHHACLFFFILILLRGTWYNFNALGRSRVDSREERSTSKDRVRGRVEETGHCSSSFADDVSVCITSLEYRL
jgi:hypothetical protein